MENVAKDNIVKFIFYIIVVLYYTWLMLSFPQGGTGAPCPPLCDLVVPYFVISGSGLLIVGELFQDNCDVIGCMIWDG